MYRRIEGSNIQTKIQMTIQPKFKLDRQWDYFTSLRTSAFYNSYSQKNIQYVALPKRCFFTSRSIFEIPLSWKTCSNHLGFFKKQRTVATGLDLSTTSPWLKTSHHIKPRCRTHDLQILQWWHLEPQETLLHRGNFYPSSNNGTFPTAIAIYPAETCEQKHPQRMPQCWIASFRRAYRVCRWGNACNAAVHPRTSSGGDELAWGERVNMSKQHLGIRMNHWSVTGRNLKLLHFATCFFDLFCHGV